MHQSKLAIGGEGGGGRERRRVQVVHHSRMGRAALPVPWYCCHLLLLLHQAQVAVPAASQLDFALASGPFVQRPAESHATKSAPEAITLFCTAQPS